MASPSLSAGHQGRSPQGAASRGDFCSIATDPPIFPAVAQPDPAVAAAFGAAIVQLELEHVERGSPHQSGCPILLNRSILERAPGLGPAGWAGILRRRPVNPWLPPSVWIEGLALARGLRRDLLCRPRRSPFVVGRDDQALRFWWRISAVQCECWAMRVEKER